MPEARTEEAGTRTAAAATAADRLERILYILPAAARDGGVRLDELARRLGVSREALLSDITEVTNRTYYHPAETGSELQIELTGERVRVWTTGEFQRPLRLTLPEALCVSMALRSAGRGEDEAVLARLEAELAAGDPARCLGEVEAADLSAGAPGIRESLLRAVQEQTVLRLRYLKPQGTEPLNRPVHPYALVYGEGHWYLLAWCTVSEGVRIFRVDRILEIRPGEGTFQAPADFDPEAYVEGGKVYRGTEEVEIRVRYSPRIARWIAEREEGEWDADGALVVTHRAADPHWAVRHVLQYGPDAVVLEPEEVRRLVRGVVGEAKQAKGNG